MQIGKSPVRSALWATFLLTLGLLFVAEAGAQEVYVLDDGNATIYKVDVSTPHVRQGVSSSIGDVGGLAVHSATGDLYYSVGSGLPSPDGKIVRANPDGTNVTDIATGLNFPTAVALDEANDFIYFIQREVDSSPAIYRVGISGAPSATQVIVGNPSFGPIDVDVDAAGGKIYWTDDRGSSIRRASLTGTSEETLVNLSTESISGIAVDSDNGRVYWLNGTTTAIQFVDTSGTFPTSPQIAVSSAEVGAGGLEVDGSQSPVMLYWTDSDSKVIRAAFGGSPEFLLELADGGIASPVDLGLFTPPMPTPTPTATATATPLSEVLTPVTVITEPPVTAVVGRTVTLSFLNFTDVSLIQSAFGSSAAEISQLAATSRLTLRYDVRVTAPSKRDNVKKLTKRNELTLKRLAPGNYSVNYSVIAYTQKTKAQREKAVQKGKSGFAAKFKKVFSTNRSPTAGFTVAP